MARSDYLFGYDPRKKEPWLNYVPEQIKSRVSKQPQRKRSTWIARGNIRAAHAGRRAKRLDEQQQIQQQMGARQNALMESRMPLDERKFRQSQIEYGQGRQDKFGMQQAGFQNQEYLAGLGNRFAENRATTANLRDIESEGRTEKRAIGAEGRAVSRADALRPIEQQEKREYFDYTQENQKYAPQYDVFEGTGGRQQYLERGSPVGEGMKRVSPSKVEVNIGPTERPSPAERTEIRDARTSLSTLDNLKALMDSDFVGPIGGRIAPYLGVLGLTGQREEEFMAATAAFKNSIIKQITGARMGIEEEKRILAQVPMPKDPPARWLAKWEESKKNVAFLLEEQMRVLRESGLIVPGETPMPWGDQEAEGMTNEQLIQAINQMRGQ